MRRPAFALRAALALVPALLAPAVAAQDAGPVEARVTYIAGDNAYLDAGTEAGLAAGDTVLAARDGRRLGPLRIVSATPDRAVVAFAAAPFPVTLGDVLLLTGSDAPEPEPEPERSAAEPVAADRPSILDGSDAPGRTPARSLRTPTLTGRFQTGVSVLASSTRAVAGGPATSRTFSLPFASLRAGVADLPGGLRLDANLRATYRSSEGFTFDRPADVRVYQLSAGKDFEAVPLQVRAGRFHTRYDRFSGYWDGLSLHLGDDDRGVGVAAGFQPDRADAAPSGDLPKYTVFGHASAEIQGARVEGTLLGGQVLPRTAGMRTRTFVGAEQSIRAQGVRLSAQALADQEPETGAWTLSRLHGRLSVTATSGVRLRAYALSRRPYILLGDLQTLLDRSTRVGGGATFTLRSGPLPGASLRLDASNAMTEARPDARTLSAGLSLPRLPLARLGFTAHATVWTQDAAPGSGSGAGSGSESGAGSTRPGVYGSAGLSRSFGPVYASVGYRYQESPLGPDDALVTHGVNALLQVPVSRRLSFTLQAGTQLGERISTTRLYTALWYRL